MSPVVTEHTVREEKWVRDDFLSRAIAAAIMASALKLAAHGQVNRVHRLERGEAAGIPFAEELSGKMVFNVMEWPHSWMLGPRPLAAMKKAIYDEHQVTLERALSLAVQNELMKGLPRLAIKTQGVEENFELSVYFV